MFGTLFIKECKQVLKSIVYFIYVVVLVLFLTSQLGEDGLSIIDKPEPGKDYYGMMQSDDKNDIMEHTLASLFLETYRNSFVTYPFGFYKQVILNSEDLKLVKNYIEECSGESFEQLEKKMMKYFESYDQTTIEGAQSATLNYVIPVKKGLKYERFLNYMEMVSETIGRGSSYSKGRLEAGVTISQTYDGALKEYEQICKEDKFTGAYARVFCDYAGIILALLPMFLGVTRCLRDKRAKASEVIFAKSASSTTILLSRYLANVFMAFFPVLIVAVIMQSPILFQAQTLGIQADSMAFFKYSFVWLLPEIMIVLAASFIITEITENVFAIFIQVFWAIISLFSSVTFVGNFGLTLVARWNVLGRTQEFMEHRSELFINRGFYIVLSFVLIRLTVYIYEKKRKEGVKIYGKIFKNRN